MQDPQFFDWKLVRLDQKSLSDTEKWAAEGRRSETMCDEWREAWSNFISRQKSGEFWRLRKIYKNLKILENLHVKHTEGSMQ